MSAPPVKRPVGALTREQVLRAIAAGQLRAIRGELPPPDGVWRREPYWLPPARLVAAVPEPFTPAARCYAAVNRAHADGRLRSGKNLQAARLMCDTFAALLQQLSEDTDFDDEAGAVRLLRGLGLCAIEGFMARQKARGRRTDER
jgi:hypothetical protein